MAQAAQSIGAGTIDMAIAGASSLTFPNLGYLWEENLVYSRDGHVKPFDQGAAGTVFGDSVELLCKFWTMRLKMETISSLS